MPVDFFSPSKSSPSTSHLPLSYSVRSKHLPRGVRDNVYFYVELELRGTHSRSRIILVLGTELFLPAKPPPGLTTLSLALPLAASSELYIYSLAPPKIGSGEEMIG